MTPQEKKSSQDQTLNEKDHHLILFNDDVNTFDYVIHSLVEICGHNEDQAEQCAIITHYKGKCSVMNGNINDLIPVKNMLNHRGLSVEIE
ncbi:MAG: ATP-dependent Clp protease adaptor ClpS [Prevotellaceae bacterium]|jgi:ATP-dependent Clp protease adaptor protein ClpS|nr:ATP-dependent Clp protease adaptor ClpS [Prevotellaceae bacterium]